MSKRDEYKVFFTDGRSALIKIPSNWRVTFGNTYPGKNAIEMSLRVYEGNNKIKAIYTGIRSFESTTINRIGGELAQEPIRTMADRQVWREPPNFRWRDDEEVATATPIGTIVGTTGGTIEN